MTRRWGTLLFLLLLLIAGCTRDAGVDSFQADEPVGETDVLPEETPEADTPSDDLAETPDDQEALEDPDDEPEIAITVATETDIPILEVTDVPTDIPTEVASPTVLPTTVEDDATPAVGFTPGGPSVPEEVQPIETTTPVPTATPFNGLGTIDDDMQDDEETDDTAITSPDDDGEQVGALDGGGSSEDGCTYTVQSGDNPFRIAVNNNITLAELREANPSLGSSNVIQPGDVLDIPGCGGGNAADAPTDDTTTTEDSAPSTPGDFIEYTVVSGDTLGRIANRYDVTVAEIAEANELTNVDRLSVGQVLLIPQSGG